MTQRHLDPLVLAAGLAFPLLFLTTTALKKVVKTNLQIEDTDPDLQNEDTDPDQDLQNEVEDTDPDQDLQNEVEDTNLQSEDTDPDPDLQIENPNLDLRINPQSPYFYKLLKFLKVLTTNYIVGSF